jgi:pimeloyl-ACP methyl ester carboxylesterase/DNA-binding CsgD family transcriptional regulator
MAVASQQVRFCTSFDFVRIAYAVTGTGQPLVNAPHWLSHLEHDLQCRVRRPWFAELSRGQTLLRFDQRGCGLSDWDVSDISFEAWVRDLECVVDAAGFDRFALLGNSQGAAIGVEYAARHPERVTQLVLWGGYARGRLQRDPTPQEVEDAELQVKLIELGWAKGEPSYRDVFSRQFMPGGSIEQLNALSELERVSSSPENASRIVRAFYSIDVRAAARRVRCPALVLHARGDRRVPLEEGRLLAASIPGARFVTLDTNNHIMLEDEPAWRRYFEEVRAFLPRAAARLDRGAVLAELTPREVEILEHIAQGLDNAQIAAHLALSEKTVRNNITHIFDKLQVENRSRAIVVAREAGLGESRPSFPG